MALWGDNDNDIEEELIVNWKQKLTSRKLWMSVASFVSMIAIALGMSEQSAGQVTALIMAGATVIAYVIGEGLVDAQNVAPTGGTDGTDGTET